MWSWIAVTALVFLGFGTFVAVEAYTSRGPSIAITDPICHDVNVF